MRKGFAALLIGSALAAASSVSAQTLPALPQTLLDSSYPALAGQTINVTAGGNLQAAINAAQLGDTILLAPGATYVGPFSLPVKTGSGWIVIRSSTPDASFPPPGTRVSPADAVLMPKIVTPDSGPAVLTVAGAHRFRITGVEFTVATGVTASYALIALGDDTQTSLANVPYDFVLDRVYIHGNATADLRRGVALNSASTAIVDSYISDVHEVGVDAQAILGWNGPGPFKITNNYLEASGENLMFGGGADPAILNLVPSDIEVRGNYFSKPLQWRAADPTYAGTPWTVKNLFELKNARRVLVDGNVFEHNWPEAQNGYSILFTVRNQDGTAPWCAVQDITFTHNIVRHVASGVNILGTDDLHTSQQTRRILIANNLFDDVNSTAWGGEGRLIQVLNGAADVTIDHNTAFQTGEVIVASGPANTGFTYRNNLTPNNEFGVAGDNFYGDSMGALANYFPGAVFVRNVLQGGNAANYPINNFFPVLMSDVLFVNLAGGNYRLQDVSLYRNAGTDGKDIGADINSLTGPDGMPIRVPQQFAATATSQTQTGLSWLPVSGSTYEVHRATTLAAGFSLTKTISATAVNDTALAPNTTYLYKVRAVALTGASAFSNVDATTTTVFTDPSLAGAAVKAIHWSEVRTAVSAMRVAASLAPVTFTDLVLPGTLVKRVHVIELRNALNAARSAIGLPAIAYSEPGITVGITTVKATHVQELRDGTR